MKKVIKFFRLRKDIKKSKRLIEAINKELDFLYSFEVVETYAWYDEVRDLRCMLGEETKKLNGLEKEKNLVFAK